MKIIRILQLAAYGSNIGDNANISGIREQLATSFSSYNLEFHDWDLVDFSWNIDSFDDSAIAFINSFDMFIIGGGGFLEIIPKTETWTGTRINIPKAIFQKITAEIVFYSVGIDLVRASAEGGSIEIEKSKLADFVDFCIGQANITLSTRHDGSIQTLEELIGKTRAESFWLVPDGGFSATSIDSSHPEIEKGKTNIAINFGGDLITARYKDNYPCTPVANNPLNIRKPADYEAINYLEHTGYTQFLISFSNVFRQIIFERQDINLILVPHIYRDLEPSYHFLSEMGFPYCRRGMTVAPYVNGFSGKDAIIDLYKKVDLTVGMRFHANVCPIGLATPSIGLGTFPMIKNLYSSLGLDKQFIHASAGDEFEDSLYNIICSSLDDKAAIQSRYKGIKSSLNQKTNDFHQFLIKKLQPR